VREHEDEDRDRGIASRSDEVEPDDERVVSFDDDEDLFDEPADEDDESDLEDLEAMEGPDA
jgi:hypothetical protein